MVCSLQRPHLGLGASGRMMPPTRQGLGCGVRRTSSTLCQMAEREAVTRGRGLLDSLCRGAAATSLALALVRWPPCYCMAVTPATLTGSHPCCNLRCWPLGARPRLLAAAAGWVDVEVLPAMHLAHLPQPKCTAAEASGALGSAPG